MALAMSRPWRDPNTGIWYLRKRVPQDLQDRLGRKIYKISLGTKDPSEAKRRHASRLADLEARWANLRSGPKRITEREAHALAAEVHDDWLSVHHDNPSFQLLWHPEFYDTLWTAELLPEIEPQPGIPGEMPITNVYYRSMRRMCLRHADRMITERGLVVDEWDQWIVARAVAAAFQRASVELARQAKGYFDPENRPPSSASTPNATSTPASPPRSRFVNVRRPHSRPEGELTLSQLFEDWWREAKAAGRKSSTFDSYHNTTKNLIEYLEYDDAARITSEDIVGFKDYRLATPSKRTGKVPTAKTVKDSDLAALKTLFGWAVINHKLPTNPAAGVTIKLGKAPRLRSKGFTDAEATAILTAAYRYENDKERPSTAAAKRWVPWLCAFTGARVGEMAQLRRQDVQQHDDGWLVRITPEAGTQKTNEARNVPLHPQIIELGFITFVESCSDGPLFLKPDANGDVLGPLQGIKNRLAEFGRSVVADINVAPNHGWRHRFKTVGMEVEIAPRILDEIQGQAARSVADSYGEVSLKTKVKAIDKFPSFDIGKPSAVDNGDAEFSVKINNIDSATP